MRRKYKMEITIEDSYMYEPEEYEEAMRNLEGDLVQQVKYGLNIIDGVDVVDLRMEREEES